MAFVDDASDVPLVKRDETRDVVVVGGGIKRAGYLIKIWFEADHTKVQIASEYNYLTMHRIIFVKNLNAGIVGKFTQSLKVHLLRWSSWLNISYEHKSALTQARDKNMLLNTIVPII